ncbi:MAG: TIGR03067 domain-containing protein [Methylococcus sp.]|nr:TIGR03067 domain-containing protein [Methylococcus sp.]
MLNELLGSWKVIGCQLNTRWLPDSIFREFRYSFTADDRFLLDWSELTYPQFVGGFPKSKSGKVIINAGANPPQIDFLPDEGPFSGKALLGIFELDHDVLKANFAFPGNPRPAEFTATNGQVYEIWQRVG